MRAPRPASVVLTLFALLACSTRAMPRVVGSPNPVGTASASGRSIRVALAVSNGAVSATSDFTWLSADGARVLGRGSRGESWFIQADSAGARVRAVSPAGVPLAWQSGLLARATDESFLTYAGKRYRGELVFVAQDTGFLVVNRLGIEDYLRGVVPLEMGSRPRSDTAALQAQAVASRSYAFVRGMDGGGYYDVRASTSDQVYGGVDAENALANAAVDATRGLVLRYQGRVVDAPFHSTCGGTTAAPSEIWRGPNGGTYLQSVSDRIPGSDRSYCDIAPRYRWTRALSATELNAALEQYLKAYASVPADGPGAARAIGVSSRTASGRVGVLDVETDKGIFTLRGNDIRYVMRVPGGEMLPSTYFSVEPEVRDGALARVTFRGQGYGHGVGMCQWGAIGRARAGQSFRAILGTYYPGTSVGSVPSP